MEAQYYDEKHKKWFSLINSGIFRPEALAPYGITKTIIAWGLGVDRLASILYKGRSLKDLEGATGDFEWLRSYKTPREQLW